MHDTFHGMNKFVIGGPLMHTAIPLGWRAVPSDFSFTMQRRLVRHVPGHAHAGFSQKLKRNKRGNKIMEKEIDPILRLKKNRDRISNSI